MVAKLRTWSFASKDQREWSLELERGRDLCCNWYETRFASEFGSSSISYQTRTHSSSKHISTILLSTKARKSQLKATGLALPSTHNLCQNMCKFLSSIWVLCQHMIYIRQILPRMRPDLIWRWYLMMTWFAPSWFWFMTRRQQQIALSLSLESPYTALQTWAPQASELN